MTDDRTEPALPAAHHGDLYRPLLVTPDEEQNIREVAANRDKLQTFKDTEKTLLTVLIADAPELHSLAESKRMRAKLSRRALWLLAQIVAFLTLLTGLNEIVSNYFKLRGVR